ncbi:MAG: EexN family lipoprotein [Cycloclasticus sp.]
MKNTKTLLLVSLAALLLSACSGEEEVRSKDWYIAHSAEQASQLDICVHRPQLSETPNCINATAAEEILKQGFDATQAYVKEHGLNNSQK